MKCPKKREQRPGSQAHRRLQPRHQAVLHSLTATKLTLLSGVFSNFRGVAVKYPCHLHKSPTSTRKRSSTYPILPTATSTTVFLLADL